MIKISDNSKKLMVTVLKLMYNIIIINITEEFCNGKIKENGKKHTYGTCTSIR